MRVYCSNSAIYALLLELSSRSSAGIIPAPPHEEFRSFVTRGIIRLQLEWPWSPIVRSIAKMTETVGVQKYSSCSGSVRRVYVLSIPREDLSSESPIVGKGYTTSLLLQHLRTVADLPDEFRMKNFVVRFLIHDVEVAGRNG